MTKLFVLFKTAPKDLTEILHNLYKVPSLSPVCPPDADKKGPAVTSASPSSLIQSSCSGASALRSLGLSNGSTQFFISSGRGPIVPTQRLMGVPILWNFSS